MGNTWASYWAIDEAALQDSLAGLPRRMSEERWHEIVSRVCDASEQRELSSLVDGALASYDGEWGHAMRTAQPDRAAYEQQMRSYYAQKAQQSREQQQDLLLVDDPESEETVPIEDGLRVVDHPTAARVLIDYVTGPDEGRRLRTYDIIHDLCCDSPIDRFLRGERLAPARAAWASFLSSLGYPNCPDTPPWWASAAYPSDHYVGFVPAARGRALLRDLRAHRLDELVADMPMPNVKRVIDFIALSSEAGRAVLAVESAS